MTPDEQARHLPEFDHEERQYIALMAMQPAATPIWRQVFNSAAFFVPSAVIGIYGLFQQDIKITGIGFLTLLVSLAWSLANMNQNSGYDAIAARVFAKMNQKIEEDRRHKA